MYPLQLFSLFPPFPRENKVFVAMSFDKRFDKRWGKVIIPGISNVRVNGIALQPFRVDARKVSDSILTEILVGISNSKLIFADITSLGYANDSIVRSGNVMYEIGIAHAVRLPEEVILFRSDKDRLLFDVANIRVNAYDPDYAPEITIKQISDTLIEALKEVDLRKNLAVRHAVDSLDFPSLNILLQGQGIVKHPQITTMGDALGNMANINAISRLLDLGILSTEYIEGTSDTFRKLQNLSIEEIIKYRLTPFGKAVYATCMNKFRTIISFIKELDAANSGQDNQNKQE